jgi:hypothetical protein
MKPQKSCCRLEVSLFDGWANNDSTASDIRSKTTEGDCPARGIQNPSSSLYSQHGFEFYQRQSRYDALGSLLIQNPFHIIRTGVLMIEFRQSTRIEKVAWHSAFFSRGNHRVRERVRDEFSLAKGAFNRIVPFSAPRTATGTSRPKPM